MSIDADYWMQRREATSNREENTAMRLRFNLKPNTRGRDMIFRTLFPGVFLFVVAYWIFVHQPSVAEFYCERFQHLPQMHLPSPKANPSAVTSERGQIA